MSSNLTPSISSAARHPSKNVAANVPRLSFDAIESRVSFSPCSLRLVLEHKLREAMAEEMKGRTLGGEGKVAEVDGGYFGGYVKPRNLAENRIDRRLARNQNGKRKVVVIVRERNGNSVPAVFRSEGQPQSWIKKRTSARRPILWVIGKDI